MNLVHNIKVVPNAVGSVLDKYRKYLCNYRVCRKYKVFLCVQERQLWDMIQIKLFRVARNNNPDFFSTVNDTHSFEFESTCPTATVE